MGEKKKISKSVVLLMATVLVGGTCSWFTSKDELRNIFIIGGYFDGGIKIEENFPGSKYDEDGNAVYNNPVSPGDVITKEVSVQSTANYDQFVRAKVVKQFRDKNGNIVTHYKIGENGDISYSNVPSEDYKELNLDNIEVIFETFATDSTNPGYNFGWYSKSNDGWYYYNQILEAEGADYRNDITSKLIKSVKLSPQLGSEYLNLRFDVQVIAESIQATSGAIKDENNGWGIDAPENLKVLDTTIVNK